MAEKRMFSPQITKSDAFLEMPATARLLYYDLSMEADDDGFVSNPKSIMRMTGAREDDLKVLISKYFILVPDAEKGIVVIKHWRINNWIRKDRYHPTNYQDLYALLEVKDNEAYTIKNDFTKQIECLQPVVNQVVTGCQPSGNQLTPESSVEKCSVDKSSLEKNILKKETTTTTRFKKPTIQEIEDYCKEKNIDLDANYFFDYYESKDWYVGKSKMKDWKASIRNWDRMNKNRKPTSRPEYKGSDF